MQMLALAMQCAPNPTNPGVDWLDDPWSFHQVYTTVIKLLDTLRPTIKDSDNFPYARLDHIALHGNQAEERALALLHSVRGADASLPLIRIFGPASGSR